VIAAPVLRSPRVQQVEGYFDLPARSQSERAWDVELPIEERPWHIGLVVGPSGCGKSTIARHLWPAFHYADPAWPVDASILDVFPDELSIKEIVALLSAVGLSSPPCWLLPFHALSTGQQFRARLAWLLAAHPDLVVLDEFTSTVDRTVARLGSHALAKAVRRRDQRFIAVTCHEDVEEWLQPDWVYRPATNTFTWRSLQGRPAVVLDIRRVHRTVWPLFRPHHYLSGSLNSSAVCFGAFWEGRLVGFSAWLPAMTRWGGRREHRTVVLPDYQGAGIGHALSTFVASVWTGLGLRATSTTGHPAFIASRQRSPLWRMTRRPGLARYERRGLRHATTRLTAGFTYIGPGLDSRTARKVVSRQ
jgi:GNAT superfamily N-acetyltransferase